MNRPNIRNRNEKGCSINVAVTDWRLRMTLRNVRATQLLLLTVLAGLAVTLHLIRKVRQRGSLRFPLHATSYSVLLLS